MNKEAFSKLKPEKQNRIINSAFNEFSSYPYDKVSVFQIAKNAKISRASFYCYFSDKKDIYLYLLNNLKTEIFNAIDADFSYPDPFDVIYKLCNKSADYKGSDNQKFIEMFFQNSNPIAQNIFIKDFPIIKKGKPKFNLTKYNSNISEQECVSLIDMLFYGLSRKLHEYYMDKISKSQVLKEFDKIIHCLFNGILKEKENAWT